MDDFRNIAVNGLWKQNPSLVQILGLCPLLAITSTLVNGVMIALATLLVMAVANLVVSLCRHWIAFEIRIPVFILLAATVVTVVDLLMNAYLHELWLVLGIFIPLIVTNCIVLARIEAFSAKKPALDSFLDGVMMGAGLVWTLALLGGIRELAANGTLLTGIDLIWAKAGPIQVLANDYPGFLLAALPPGAFITLGLLIAGKNAIESQLKRRVDSKTMAHSLITPA